jgi:hypothetical protein
MAMKAGDVMKVLYVRLRVIKSVYQHNQQCRLDRRKTAFGVYRLKNVTNRASRANHYAASFQSWQLLHVAGDLRLDRRRRA